METFLFTSESVNEGHPDKLCDQISDAVLDACLEQDPDSKVACETCTKTNMVMVFGEITTKATVDYEKIVRDTCRSIDLFCVFDRRMEEIQNTDLTKNPEVEDTIESSKQKQPEEVEHHCDEQQQKQAQEEDEDELRKLLLSDIGELPLSPPSATQVNFVSYFITDFTKPGHDHYIYRHANGLCVVGLAPTHIAFKDQGGITNIDFNVGKSDRSVLKVSGKRKKNAMRSESNTALCKVSTAIDSYIVRCCVKGSLLEVNERLIKQPHLLNSSADREGYIAIIMPRPVDWTKNKESLITLEEYKDKKQDGLLEPCLL